MCLIRFSKLQRLPVLLQTLESQKYLTNITASCVRRADCQIQASATLIKKGCKKDVKKVKKMKRVSINLFIFDYYLLPFL